MVKVNRKKKFLSGSIDLGLQGNVPILIFPNDKRDKNKKLPHYNIMIKVFKDKHDEKGKWKNVGALWIHESQDKPEIEPETEELYYENEQDL